MLTLLFLLYTLRYFAVTIAATGTGSGVTQQFLADLREGRIQEGSGAANPVLLFQRVSLDPFNGLIFHLLKGGSRVLIPPSSEQGNQLLEQLHAIDDGKTLQVISVIPTDGKPGTISDFILESVALDPEGERLVLA